MVSGKASNITNDLYDNTNESIPGESPNSIITNTCAVGSNGERTSYLMFYVPWGACEKGFWWFLDLNQFTSN